MNLLKNLTIIALVSIPLISSASSNLWERKMQQEEADKAPPAYIEGEASKMGHTAVEHKRYMLGENYPTSKINFETSTKNSNGAVDEEHTAVEHKRYMLGENYPNQKALSKH